MIQKTLTRGLFLFILLILFFCFLPRPVNAAGCDAYQVIMEGPCQLHMHSPLCPDGFETVISDITNEQGVIVDCDCDCVDSSAGGGARGNREVTEVETAIGPISFEPDQFVIQLIKILISISGGIALILMIFGSLQVILSSGNPDKIKGGQEIITSAIMGLIFIVFSIFLLQFIGVDLFAIPGFGGN